MIRPVMSEYLQKRKYLAFLKAEDILGELSARDRAVLGFAFAEGLIAALDADKIIEKVYNGGLDHA